MAIAIAHSRNDRGSDHALVGHLQAVAEMTKRLAAGLGASDVGYYVGLWHDVGKFHSAFQRYLRDCQRGVHQRRRGPDHKAAGAELAAAHGGPLALLVQGHHGGLRTRADLMAWLQARRRDPALSEALAVARAQIADLAPPTQIPFPAHLNQDPLAAELFLRLLFSALVDADYLDTERHFSPEKATSRGQHTTLAELWARFQRDQLRFAGCTGPVNDVRRQVYEACLAAAKSPPGLFRLTVPTGGGKTRSAMAFALRHALLHDLRRVVVVAPYIAITHQTAGAYRSTFDRVSTTEGAAEEYRAIFERGDADWPVVLEHHSDAEQDVDDESFDRASVWRRLAAENWDAPIVVTTTVQLLESLFSNRPARCRKLHRLARSVIILDEAQALPPRLLSPILDSLSQLCRYYGTTVVLSTATQPAFDVIGVFRGLGGKEIAPNPPQLFAALKRVDYEWRTDPAMGWEEIADLLREEQQGLAVLNTRRDALALLDALEDPDALHLSTLLCGAHRRRVIQKVRDRLIAGGPCRLISTQVVEAGVDLDFPLVIRALGPLDGIIQAAGRCNREGRLPRGRVIVVRPADGGVPPGVYRTACDVTAATLGGRNIDPNDPRVVDQYFRLLFTSVDTDALRIQERRRELDYPAVAERFRMIDEDTESVVITRYGSPHERARVQNMLSRLRAGTPDARLLVRQLQPYMVAVRRRELQKYARQGLAAEVIPGVNEWLAGYDPVRGLAVAGLDAEQMVV